MAIHVTDEETDAAVRRLAALRGKGITETIREAVESELRRSRQTGDLVVAIKALQREVAAIEDVDPRSVRAIRDDLNDGL